MYAPITHACFNAKLNFTDGDGNDVYIGCMDSDLEGFAVTAPPRPATRRVNSRVQRIRMTPATHSGGAMLTPRA